ncbi:MAG: RES family NAD+ phosphorylase [Inquilinus sp.]|uniref:RES family NAD+ phosphorylase n=1 Tax=Inquilinus sp. TaxID=1932117 RepID=UPI003F3202EA
MSTHDVLSSEAKPYASEVWRVVESQHTASTMRLTDTREEQELLEDLIEEVKPGFPPETRGLDYLLATPFRYAPYRHGSRFRRAGQREGAYYAAEDVKTALAETAFYRLLFLAESPGMPLPERPYDFTAFSVDVATDLAIDLTAPPFDNDTPVWTHLTDYGPCQDLADTARAAAIGLIRYRSVRDPAGGANVAVLSPLCFQTPRPKRDMQTWKVFLLEQAVQIWRTPADPRGTLFSIDRAVFSADPRLADLGPA